MACIADLPLRVPQFFVQSESEKSGFMGRRYVRRSFASIRRRTSLSSYKLANIFLGNNLSRRYGTR